MWWKHMIVVNRVYVVVFVVLKEKSSPIARSRVEIHNPLCISVCSLLCLLGL